jgi:hypothetical protein
MKLYQFREEGSHRLALTCDPSGDNLPQEGGVWEVLGEMGLADAGVARLGVSAREIARAVERDGFFIWPKS